MKFLELLSEKYPTIQSACTEIINLNAILNLPKGTEHFVSDIHGESDAFTHILNNASGVIREKVDTLFSRAMDKKTRTELCTLIYYPELKLKEIVQGRSDEDLQEWYMITLYRLIEVCRYFSSKYTRSKVRKALPKDFEYILEELLNVSNDTENKQDYYENIVQTIISIGRADAFISALSGVIKRLAVDHLHVVGDIFDRGPHPDIILEKLMRHHAVDIQWGNHDVLWMGAAAGSAACIACLLNISTKYGNIDLLENAYGINLRPLAMFAEKVYADAPDMLSRMHQAIAVIQLKLEADIIRRRPDFGMEDRLLLDKIDFENMTVRIADTEHPLRGAAFPTVDPDDPYELTEEENEVVSRLIDSFRHCEKLQRQMQFLYSQGSLYRVFNGNLLFHGCIPMNENGTFFEFDTGHRTVAGREYMDWADQMVRKAYYAPERDRSKKRYLDFVWYLWCGPGSPLFGRDAMRTFERMYIEDESTWTENKNPYYRLVEDEAVCEMLLAEFGLSGKGAHIINGHVPVLAKKGEMPVRGGGRLIIIDGGFSKAYQPKTGIAGYTLFYSSYGLRLVSHQPFAGLHDAVRENKDILSTYVVFDTADKRLRVSDTDNGRSIRQDIEDLSELLDAYRKGTIKEKRKHRATM